MRRRTDRSEVFLSRVLHTCSAGKHLTGIGRVSVSNRIDDGLAPRSAGRGERTMELLYHDTSFSSRSLDREKEYQMVVFLLRSCHDRCRLNIDSESKLLNGQECRQRTQVCLTVSLQGDVHAWFAHARFQCFEQSKLRWISPLASTRSVHRTGVWADASDARGYSHAVSLSFDMQLICGEPAFIPTLSKIVLLYTFSCPSSFACFHYTRARRLPDVGLPLF